MGKATDILTRKGIAKKKSPKYKKTDLTRALCQEEVKGYSVIDQVGVEDILTKTVKAAGISVVEETTGSTEVKVLKDNIPLTAVGTAGTFKMKVLEGNSALETVLTEEISVGKFERSIGRMSKELKEESFQKKSLPPTGVWNGEGISVKERLDNISLTGSILSPYQIKRK